MVDHVAKCIESVRDQPINVQHIIVDGGSIDGTLEVVDRLSHPNLQLITEPDNGQSDAINKGLKMANGEIFNWLNADDRLKPNALKNVAELMTDNVSAVLGKCEHVHPSKDDTVMIGQSFLGDSIGSTMANYSMAQPSHFYRTDHIKALGGLNSNLHYVMDMDLWFRFLLKYGGAKIVGTDTVLSEFWLFENSKSTAQSKAMRLEKYAIFMTVLVKLNAPEFLLEMVAEKASDIRIDYPMYDLESTNFLSEFSWHLLLEAYDNGDLDRASKLLDLVNLGPRLNSVQRAEWLLRVKGPSSIFIKKLRGK